MVTPLFWVWGSLFGLTSHRRHSAAISPACHGRDLGLFLAFHVEPHGDGNQRVFITVPEGRATITCRAYRVPSCMPSSIQRSLSGPSIDRSCHLAASSGYLQLLGYQDLARLPQSRSRTYTGTTADPQGPDEPWATRSVGCHCPE